MKTYLRIALLGGGLVAGMSMALALDPPIKPLVIGNNSVAWYDCPGMPPGCRMLVLYGDPAKPGDFGVRFKYVARYRIGPHQHAVEEHATLISGGPMHVAVGDTFDDKAPSAQTVHAGDIVVVPPGIHHFAWVDNETILQVNGSGPFKREFINPANNQSGVPKELDL